VAQLGETRARLALLTGALSTEMDSVERTTETRTASPTTSTWQVRCCSARTMTRLIAPGDAHHPTAKVADAGRCGSERPLPIITTSPFQLSHHGQRISKPHQLSNRHSSDSVSTRPLLERSLLVHVLSPQFFLGWVRV
jgi:hypothetical protein